MNSIVLALGIAGTILESALFVCLASDRSTRRQLPCFTGFAGILACSDLFLLYVRTELGASEYFWCWWAQFAVLSIAKALIIIEVFRGLFSPIWTVPAGPMRTFYFAIMLFAVALIGYAVLSPAVYLASALRILRTIGRTMNLFLFFCTLFVLALASYFRIPWREKFTGVTAGFCVEICVESIISSIRAAENHRVVQQLLSIDEMAAWLVVVLFWLLFFGRSRTEPASFSPEMVGKIQQIASQYRERLHDALLQLS